MKFHFESDLDYQLAAIDAVSDLFRGQEVSRSEFSVRTGGSLPGLETDLGIGNLLAISEAQLIANLIDVQTRNGLPPTPILESRDFTIEMETGTGKTYVYLRTIFELHKLYGFAKFVIVVPSIAIKEGVYKSLQIMEEHFNVLYSRTPFDYFLYDSSKLGPVRRFATSPSIQIMVVTVGAINKPEINNLYKPNDQMGGDKPIDLISAARPIVIVDEPQSVDGGLEGQGRKALAEMNPLCTLRYSATHAAKFHMIYRLDAVDAYERDLVKHVEVASLEVEGGHNKPYLKLISTSNKNGRFSAKVELDVMQSKGVARKTVTVKPGDDLERVADRSLYSNTLVQRINVKSGEEAIELSNRSVPLRVSESIGDVDKSAIARLMIRRTIEEHFDKECRLTSRGIKVLSLFFIDAVENYRQYDEPRRPIKGKYALIFEEEYRAALAKPKYAELVRDGVSPSAEEVHDGYFSIDKKGLWANTSENSQAGRDNAERAYNLIMRDKELLLGFESKLKFIFSHSALKEGWDNPNVFQICAIREIGTERERRQTIGRGLRLCVNQNGERQRGSNPNTLTVVATESYEDFAENLQKEISRDTGIRFGVVAKDQFAAIVIKDESGQTTAFGAAASTALWNHLFGQGYLDDQGKVQETLRTALRSGDLHLPESTKPLEGQIAAILRKLSGKVVIKNAAERRTIRTRQAVLKSDEFRTLWDRIKYKTTYRVQFDNAELIRNCKNALENAPPVTKTRVQIRKADLTISRSGVEAAGTSSEAPIVLEENDYDLPDLLTALEEKTQLTRQSLAGIVIDSGRLDDFRHNPQQFLDFATIALNRAKSLAIVDGIRYQKVGDGSYYAQELFEIEELTGYLKNMIPATKSVYDHVVYDSATIERPFAEELELNTRVKVYAKLPGWFTVPTPLGMYNPDWAVLVEADGAERLYFVVETKGSLLPDEIRATESAKITCAKAHFRALSTAQSSVSYVVARNINDFTAYW